MEYCDLLKLTMEHPGDVSRLAELLADGKIRAEEIKGIIAQTEGDGYARGYATLAFQTLLSPYLGWTAEEVFDRIPMMMIGKTGGLMSPHYTLFLKRACEETDVKDSDEKKFVFGVASSRKLAPEEIGTTVQVDLTAVTVKRAMLDAGLTSADDVHCVEIKCPWGIGGARSKASSALGSAVALGEIDRESVVERSINEDHSLYSEKTSVSAGGEQTAVRVIVMGNSKGSPSPLRIGSGVMKDAFDLEGLIRTFRSVGMEASPVLANVDQARIVQAFVNAGCDALPHIRGQRHTIHSDALSMHAGIVAKAVANAVVGSFVGDASILCSAGSEHQGPQGSNLVALVIRD
ncbi:ring-opening amidohydrolase [Cohnella thailandensis]|uniref:Cyclic amide hydrolase n=1 Tax=Cohnella thailandensis TaxID=557557 RepID=A0A841T076_9BACL|nr:ring-opening amidohydrolase [Cohnella thailandensis]MBB6636499.1 amidohydrolase [Cohnella thailandensis]MBP1977629.1 cyanuric acid amidohydrolase [Cohnella thailandensis]